MKDEHTYGKNMATKGRTKVIYKGTFVFEQSLSRFVFLLVYYLLLFFTFCALDVMFKLTPKSTQIQKFPNYRLSQIAVEKGQIFVLFAYEQ